MRPAQSVAMEITTVVQTTEFWLGISTALALEDLARRALRARLGLSTDSGDESDSN